MVDRPATSSISVEDDRPGISLLEYVLTPAGKQDPNINEQTKQSLRKVWKRSRGAR